MSTGPRRRPIGRRFHGGLGGRGSRRQWDYRRRPSQSRQAFVDHPRCTLRRRSAHARRPPRIPAAVVPAWPMTTCPQTCLCADLLEAPELIVEVDVFSGRENPTWRLTEAEAAEFSRRRRRFRTVPTSAHLPDIGLSYRGTWVRAHDSNGHPLTDDVLLHRRGIALGHDLRTAAIDRPKLGALGPEHRPDAGATLRAGSAHGPRGLYRGLTRHRSRMAASGDESKSL